MLNKKSRLFILSTLSLGLFLGVFFFGTLKSADAFPNLSSDGKTCTPCHSQEFENEHTGRSTGTPTTPDTPTTPTTPDTPITPTTPDTPTTPTIPNTPTTPATPDTTVTAPGAGTASTNSANDAATTSKIKELPQTGVEGIYFNYLAGTGLLIPGAALLVTRKKNHK